MLWPIVSNVFGFMRELENMTASNYVLFTENEFIWELGIGTDRKFFDNSRHQASLFIWNLRLRIKNSERNSMEATLTNRMRVLFVLYRFQNAYKRANFEWIELSSAWVNRKENCSHSLCMVSEVLHWRIYMVNKNEWNYVDWCTYFAGFCY